MGAPFTLSTIATSSIEEVTEGAPNTLRFFQLYIYRDRWGPSSYLHSIIINLCHTIVGHKPLSLSLQDSNLFLSCALKFLVLMTASVKWCCPIQYLFFFFFMELSGICMMSKATCSILVCLKNSTDFPYTLLTNISLSISTLPREVTASLVRRAEAAGFSALVLTVDAPQFGIRRADVRNRFVLPPHLR